MLDGVDSDEEFLYEDSHSDKQIKEVKEVGDMVPIQYQTSFKAYR